MKLSAPHRYMWVTPLPLNRNHVSKQFLASAVVLLHARKLTECWKWSFAWKIYIPVSVSGLFTSVLV